MSTAARPEVCLRARALSAARGDRRVLDGIDLEARMGEAVAIHGPNGAGKSTLLEILALLRPTAGGELRWFGHAAGVADLATRRRMTLVMQPALLLNRSVLDNVRYGLRARGRSAADAGVQAQRALDRVGLTALADRSAKRLSAGERQRVNLARALALPVEVLLLDEPDANLDEASTRKLAAILEEIREAGRHLIVIASPTESLVLPRPDTVLELPAASAG